MEELKSWGVDPYSVPTFPKHLFGEKCPNCGTVIRDVMAVRRELEEEIVVWFTTEIIGGSEQIETVGTFVAKCPRCHTHHYYHVIADTVRVLKYLNLWPGD